MYLLLIRHGESVDNASGILAGSTDSPLSSHGVIQARRLGEHLASRKAEIGPVVHVFTSDLYRAHNTAREVVAAQASASASPSSPAAAGRPPIVPLALLREKDFGSREGTAFSRRSAQGGRNGGSIGAPPAAGFVEAETREQMTARMERFVRAHLLPLLSTLVPEETAFRQKQAVVVVAHGIILNFLTRVLLSELSRSEHARLFGSPQRAPGPTGTDSQPPRSGDFIIPWRNTAYLEAIVFPKPPPPLPLPGPPAFTGFGGDDSHRTRPSLGIRVLSINNTRHLDGLKKTRGGIGSARFDTRQRTIDAFLHPSGPRGRGGPLG